jgi:hypothetical protein
MVRQFTFSDLAAARDFVQSRHADRDVTITWSLPVAVHRDARDTITLSPSTAPRTKTAGLSAAAADDVQEAISIAEAGTEERHEEPPPSPMATEVRKVLEVKRWEFVPGVFAGFHSPPGRF